VHFRNDLTTNQPLFNKQITSWNTPIHGGKGGINNGDDRSLQSYSHIPIYNYISRTFLLGPQVKKIVQRINAK
jgi:hypothetical protein